MTPESLCFEPCLGKAPASPNKLDNFPSSPTSIANACRFGFTTSPSGSPRSFSSPRSSPRLVSSPTDDEYKNDTARAGLRSKNPGILRTLETETVSPAQSRVRCLPHRYGNQDWKPSKAAAVCPNNGVRSPRGTASDFTAVAVGSQYPAKFRGWTPASRNTLLGNYLNDMKKSACAKRLVVGEPSPSLQKMNDRQHKLPADRWGRPVRSASCDLGGSASLIASASPRRLANEESDDEECYGFSRKRYVHGHAARSFDRNFLAHSETKLQPSTPRRSRPTNERFEELVGHMHKSSPMMKQQFRELKNKNLNTYGLLHHETRANCDGVFIF